MNEKTNGERRTPPHDRRGTFVEKLSMLLVMGAFIGGFIVLLDVRLTLTFWGQVVDLGREGFSQDTKGMVLQSMLITGFAAAVTFWLGTTKQGQEQAQSVSRIAEAAPAVAAAVAAAQAAGPAFPKDAKIGDRWKEPISGVEYVYDGQTWTKVTA